MCRERLVALVIRVRDERHTRGQQLGRVVRSSLHHPAGWWNLTRGRRRVLAILELRLGHRVRKVDIPQRRRFDLGRASPLATLRRNSSGSRAATASRLSRRSSTSRPTGRVFQRSLEAFSSSPSALAELDEIRTRDRNRLLGRLRRATNDGSYGSDGSRGRRNSSARDAPSPSRCRPIHRIEQQAFPRMRWKRATSPCGWNEKRGRCVSEPLTVGGGVSIEYTSSRGRERSNR